jgi:hypothetical protein
MQDQVNTAPAPKRVNKGKLTGQSRRCGPKHVWSLAAAVMKRRRFNIGYFSHLGVPK